MHLRGVGVLVRQHPVAAGYQRHGHTQFGVGVGEFDAGHPATHHDEVVGQRVQVVELPPGQDALAVGGRRRQDPGAGAGGDQHHIGIADRGAAVACGHLDAVTRQTGSRVDQLAASRDQLDTHAQQLGGDIHRLFGSERLDPLVDFCQTDLRVVDVDVETQAGCASQFSAQPRGGDKGLRWHAVAQHRGAADPVGIDDGDAGYGGTSCSRNQCRLVPGRAATEDHNAGHHSRISPSWTDGRSSETPSLTIAGVFIDDDMHGGFLSRGSAAVNTDVVGTVIRTWIRRVQGEGDEPTRAHVADLIVD